MDGRGLGGVCDHIDWFPSHIKVKLSLPLNFACANIMCEKFKERESLVRNRTHLCPFSIEFLPNHGHKGHGWAQFRTRLSLSFNFSHTIFCTGELYRNGEGEPGNEAINDPCTDLLELNQGDDCCVTGLLGLTGHVAKLLHICTNLTWQSVLQNFPSTSETSSHNNHLIVFM